MSFSAILFEQMPVIGILRNVEADDVKQLLPIYWEEGLTNIEITMNTYGAVQMIRDGVKAFKGKLNVGAGTVRTLEELESALTAGAQFIVTPVVNPEVIEACYERSIPVFPGAFTPTEVFWAWELGATAVKIFPAEFGGISYVKSLMGPLDNVPMIPTGGVSAENISAFFEAGVYGVGIGSHLFPKAAIATKDWDAIRKAFQNLVSAYKSISKIKL